MFPHCNIHKNIRTSPNWKAHNQIDHIWETIRQNIKISAKKSLGYYELKKHKPRFDEGCSKLFDWRKQAEVQWLQDPNEINRDSLNSVICKVSTHFMIKKMEEI
jgi:hypothetical protein